MTPHDFSLRQLQYAIAVLDGGGFRRAAERCHVSQPALSAQILQLEAVLGIALFVRDSRGVRATEAGEVLLAQMRTVLDAADALVTHARRLSASPVTGLAIGVIPTMGPYLLPDLVPWLVAERPQWRIDWREDRTPALVKQLGVDLDAALVALEAELGDVESVVIGRDQFALAVGPSHPLAGTADIDAAALSGQSVLVLDDGHCFRDQVLDFCSRSGAAEAGFRNTSLRTIAQVVAAGRGITLLPEMAVQAENSQGLLSIRRFRDPIPGRTIALVWPRHSPNRRLLRELGATLSSWWSRHLAPAAVAQAGKNVVG